MAANQAENLGVDARAEARDEVFHRARATGPDGRAFHLVIVNISAHGLMARCDLDYAVGQKLRLTVPTIGIVAAEIRWTLGGRIGCRLESAIPAVAYYRVLAAMSAG